MPYREKLDQSADNHWNVYRYHVENPIPFRRAIKVEIEHGSEGFNNTRRGGWNNDYSSVAYWYMKKPVGLKGSLVPASERASAFRPKIVSSNIFEIQLMDGCTTPSVGVEANPQALDTFVQGGRYNWLLGITCSDTRMWTVRCLARRSRHPKRLRGTSSSG